MPPVPDPLLTRVVTGFAFGVLVTPALMAHASGLVRASPIATQEGTVAQTKARVDHEQPI